MVGHESRPKNFSLLFLLYYFAMTRVDGIQNHGAYTFWIGLYNLLCVCFALELKSLKGYCHSPRNAIVFKICKTLVARERERKNLSMAN